MNPLYFRNDRRICADDIINSIINLRQLVFEVTDACNLKCKYCAYGDLYYGYDERDNSFLRISKGKAIIDYLNTFWEENTTSTITPLTYISFYGGEPLMNMEFIKGIVDYIETRITNRNIVYSMTTNGLLLDKHIDYLVKKNFDILISLDGDKDADAYRKTVSGEESFVRVFNQVKSIQENWPTYFEKHINFNAVLHNLNSVESLITFFHNNFEKNPTISELNCSNIRDDRKEEFNSMFKDKNESIETAKNQEKILEVMDINDPRTRELLLFLHRYSGNVYNNYSDLFANEEKDSFCPTGTCIPFGKKMFITVNGKILQCEKIPQSYSLGYIDDDNKVILNIESIVDNFNKLLDKMQNMCSRCYKKRGCSQCLYYIENINNNVPNCQAFMDKESFISYSQKCYSHLYRHPELYRKLLDNVILD